MTGRSELISISHDQTYVQLAFIQSASLGVPVIIVGQQLARQYGAGVAICSILIGNLILWLIAMAIISMAIVDRTNAIQNVKSYLGKYGALFMAVILVFAFLDWFVLQINSSVPSIAGYFGIHNNKIIVRIGAGIGFFTALLSIGGIQIIKWLTTATLPLLFCYYFYSILQSDYSVFSAPVWGVSVSAVISAVLILLPGIINLPTFFRHARSRADCYLALTIITFLVSFFEISTIWMNFTSDYEIVYSQSQFLFPILTLVFVVMTLIYTNLLNIYFASACWETFAPHFEGAKGYAIIGLIGTAAYTFIQIYAPIHFLENLADCYIGSLGAILLIAFLIRIIVRHRPRTFEKAINGFCWLVGCLVSTVLVIQNRQDDLYPLLMGIAASTLVFLCIIFVEETIWSAKKTIFDK